MTGPAEKQHFNEVDRLYLRFAPEIERLQAAIVRTRGQIERTYTVGRPPRELAGALRGAGELWFALGETYSTWATALEAAYPERAAA